MNNKGIKLMLLGIAVMIFGFGWQIFNNYFISDLFYHIRYENSFYDWVEAVFHHARTAIMILSFLCPLAGLVLAIIGFRVRDNDNIIEVIGEIVEINDEDETGAFKE